MKDLLLFYGIPLAALGIFVGAVVGGIWLVFFLLNITRPKSKDEVSFKADMHHILTAVFGLVFMALIFLTIIGSFLGQRWR